jgi:hypothetical protein
MTAMQLVWGRALVEALAVIAVMAVATSIHYFIQRRFPGDRLRKHNDVAGFMFSAVSVIYAVVLGFVVIIVWGKYDAAVTDSNSEIAAVADAYRSVDALPVGIRTRVRVQLHAYIDQVMNTEFPAMTQGRRPGNVSPILERIAGDLERFNPTTRRGQNEQLLAMRFVQQIFDKRRLRVDEDGPNIPSVLWFALVAGAIAMLGFIFLFGVENARAQLTMTAVLSGLIAVLFVVVYHFDRPYSHGIGISPHGWQALHQRLPYIQ